MHSLAATKSMQFNPTIEVPALQYVGNVEAAGSADEAGLRTGDFIIEVWVCEMLTEYVWYPQDLDLFITS